MTTSKKLKLTKIEECDSEELSCLITKMTYLWWLFPVMFKKSRDKSLSISERKNACEFLESNNTDLVKLTDKIEDYFK